MIKAVIFDYDGVIVDSLPIRYEVYKAICKKLNKLYPQNLDNFKKLYMGGHINFLKKSGFSNEEIEKSKTIYKKEVLKNEMPIFEGIANVIKRLHEDYKLILISAYYENEIIRKTKEIGVFDCLSLIYGSVRSKLKSKFFLKALKKLNLKRSEVIIIGDREIDYMQAKKAGLQNIILVEYGWGYDRNKLRGFNQKTIVKEPLDLLDAVKNMSEMEVL